MVFGISGDKLTVYHTEVEHEDEGEGLAKNCWPTWLNTPGKTN
jgi:predicted GNAT family acetyltransferase